MHFESVDSPFFEKGYCWGSKAGIASSVQENVKKRQRLEIPLWEELPEVHKDALGEALHKTLLRANVGDENLDLRDTDGEWNFSAMHSHLQDFLAESFDEAQPVPHQQVHVGMTEYMGDSHVDFGKTIDFIETSSTWYDTDHPNRRCDRSLPDECGWQDPSLYDDLAARADNGFSLLVNVSHVATHMCRLEEPESWWPELWQQKYSRLARGAFAFLWEFAPKFQYNQGSRAVLEELFDYLAQRPEGTTLRHIVDFRNESWYNEDVYDLLKANGVCLAWLHLQNSSLAADLPDGWTPIVQTTDFIFIRLFGNEDRCSGLYDHEFLETLYHMCPKNARSYVLFGKVATNADSEILASLNNAKNFRSIFSAVDFLEPLVSIQNNGSCPRVLDIEDAKCVTRFFIRYSEAARFAGIRLGMTVNLVEGCDGRCFEWSCEANDLEPIRLGLHDIRENQDLMRFAKQITGMEDVDVVEDLCLMGERELSTAEAQLVNSTFIRFSHTARQMGLSRTTPAKVASCSEELVVYWTGIDTAKSGLTYSNMSILPDESLAALSIDDLRTAMEEEPELLTFLCGTALAEDAVKHETESDEIAVGVTCAVTDMSKLSDIKSDAGLKEETIPGSHGGTSWAALAAKADHTLVDVTCGTTDTDQDCDNYHDVFLKDTRAQSSHEGTSWAVLEAGVDETVVAATRGPADTITARDGNHDVLANKEPLSHGGMSWAMLEARTDEDVVAAKVGTADSTCVIDSKHDVGAKEEAGAHGGISWAALEAEADEEIAAKSGTTDMSNAADSHHDVGVKQEISPGSDGGASWAVLEKSANLRMQPHAAGVAIAKAEKANKNAAALGSVVRTELGLPRKCWNHNLKRRMRRPLGRFLVQLQKSRRFRKQKQRSQQQRPPIEHTMQTTRGNTFATGDASTVRLDFASIVASCRATIANCAPLVNQ